MPVMLQVRNLPDEIHAKLKQRARDAGLSLSDFVAQELAAVVATKSNREVMEWVKLNRDPSTTADTADAVHASREERDEQIWSSTHPRSSTS